MKVPPPKMEMVDIDRVKPWPGNPRTKHDTYAITQSMEAVGYVCPIVVQKGTYRILAGHGRYSALVQRGATEIPVIVADVDDNRADLFTIGDNKIGELSEWNFSKYADLLLDLERRNINTAMCGVTESELADIMLWTPEGEETKRGAREITCPKCGQRFEDQNDSTL